MNIVLLLLTRKNLSHTAVGKQGSNPTRVLMGLVALKISKQVASVLDIKLRA